MSESGEQRVPDPATEEASWEEPTPGAAVRSTSEADRDVATPPERLPEDQVEDPFGRQIEATSDPQPSGGRAEPSAGPVEGEPPLSGPDGEAHDPAALDPDQEIGPGDA